MKMELEDSGRENYKITLKERCEMFDFKPGLWYTTGGFFGYLSCNRQFVLLQEDGKPLLEIEVDYDGWITEGVGFLKTAQIGQERLVKGTEVEWPKVSVDIETAHSHQLRPFPARHPE